LIGYGKSSNYFLRVIPSASHIGPFKDPASLEPHFRGKGFKSIKKLSLSGVVSDDDTDDEEQVSPKKKTVSGTKSPPSVKKSAKKTVSKVTKVTPKRSVSTPKGKKSSTPKSSAKGKAAKGKKALTPKSKKAAVQDDTDEKDEELMELSAEDEGDVVGEDLDSALVGAA
jgi:hypothetical protein